MKIRKMAADFGMLENATLELTDGLNIIHSPNESGKSTWCAFIRSMLYGISTSEREKAGFKPDKIKFAPWSGAPMQGEIDLTHGGQDITLRRSGKASAPFRDFSATFTGTANPVPGLASADVGESLTGVSRSVFERSAFISQSSVGITASPELERRIAAIVSTGEETSSFSDTDKKLREWLRKRRYNNHGQLPELEKEIEAAQSRQREASGKLTELEELFERAEEVSARSARLKSQVEESRKLQRKEVLSRLSDARSQLGAAQEKLENSRTHLETCSAEFTGGIFGGAEPDELREQIEADSELAKTLFARSAQKASPLITVILIIASLTALFFGLTSAWWLILIGAALLIVSAVFALRLADAHTRIRNAKTQLSKLLEKYGVTSPDDISTVYSEHERRFAAMQSAADAEKSAQLELDSMQESQKTLETKMLQELDFSGGEGEAVRLGSAFASSEAELISIKEKIASLEGALGEIGDPLVFNTELGNKKARHSELSNQYDALELAVETLRDADNELQSRFSPQLAHRAAEYLSQLTGGRYTELNLTKDMSALVREANSTAVRDTDFLSAGTVDQIYLALRLAICELALPDENPCPLILDDALVNFDEQRVRQAVALLEKIAKTRQVILFTCREV